MKCIQLLLLFGIAYLAIVSAQEDPSEVDVKENDVDGNDAEENDPKENDAEENDPKENDPKENDPEENDPKENDVEEEGDSNDRVRSLNSDCSCTKEYKPICGSNGVTYSNKCFYECENKQRASEGRQQITVRCPGPCNQCPKLCVCNKAYKPVCGSDGFTYNNQCLLDCENENRSRDGKPKINSFPGQCPACPCPANYAPVCGDDNITYGNECALKCKNDIKKKLGEKTINVICYRACEECQSECVCPFNYAPVCGSDGKTYSNSCGLNCENKRRKKAGKPGIVTICNNSCDKCLPECPCPLVYLPVCGSNGITYSNECGLNCENERRKRQGQPPISIRCYTACSSCSVVAIASAQAYAYA